MPVPQTRGLALPRVSARSLPLLAGLVAGACALAVFAGSSPEPRPSLPPAAAKRAMLADPTVHTFLRDHPWTTIRIAPLDRHNWRVTVQDGQRALADANVAPDATVANVSLHFPGAAPPGSREVWRLPVLLMLTALFLAAVAVAPLRSARNLDACVLGIGVLATLILDLERLVRPQAFAASALLVYLAARAAWIAVRPGEPEGSVSLWRRSTARLGVTERNRILTTIGAATVALALLVTITSTGISDVAFAGLAGGTTLTHGALPYGHLTSEIVHGDTYPLLSYVLYLPFALVSPVNDGFDAMDGSLYLNAIALIAAAAAMYRWGKRAGSREGGALLALAWLTFPPVLLAASSGGNDVPTAALMALAIAVWHRPLLSALLLGAATWVKIGPVVALVDRLAQLRGRPLAIACAGTAALTLAAIVALVALGGGHGPARMVDALRFQLERGSYHSLWQQLGARGRAVQHMFEAFTVAALVASASLIATRPEVRADLRRVAALIAAGLLLVQLGANYWAPAYLTWVLPFILVALFPPARLRSRPPASLAP